jgi:hypothetical protein
MFLKTELSGWNSSSYLPKERPIIEAFLKTLLLEFLGICICVTF